MLHVVRCLYIHVGRVASNRTLHEFAKLLQVPSFNFGVTVGEALNSLDAVCNCIHHLAGMDDSWVGDIIMSKLNRVHEALVSC